MTTLLYDHEKKQIAIDSRMTSSQGVIVSDNSDKTILNDLGLWFCAGSVCDHKDLVKLSHNDECKIVPDSSALLISNGIAYLVHVSDKGICLYETLTCNDSLGSGYKWALSALDFGQTAKQAVEYSITKDCYSGGNVRVFNMNGDEV